MCIKLVITNWLISYGLVCETTSLNSVAHSKKACPTLTWDYRTFVFTLQKQILPQDKFIMLLHSKKFTYVKTFQCQITTHYYHQTRTFCPKSFVISSIRIVQAVSVNYCHFQLNSALVKANLFMWKQCQSNKQGLEFHVWVALWMTCSMWAPWDSQTTSRRNTKFCTTRASIRLVTCAQLSLILSFSSGRVQGALLNTMSFRLPQRK
jgi:hypothetical protein